MSACLQPRQFYYACTIFELLDLPVDEARYICWSIPDRMRNNYHIIGFFHMKVVPYNTVCISPARRDISPRQRHVVWGQIP